MCLAKMPCNISCPPTLIAPVWPAISLFITIESPTINPSALVTSCAFSIFLESVCFELYSAIILSWASWALVLSSTTKTSLPIFLPWASANAIVSDILFCPTTLATSWAACVSPRPRAPSYLPIIASISACIVARFSGAFGTLSIPFFLTFASAFILSVSSSVNLSLSFLSVILSSIWESNIALFCFWVANSPTPVKSSSILILALATSISSAVSTKSFISLYVTFAPLSLYVGCFADFKAVKMLTGAVTVPVIASKPISAASISWPATALPKTSPAAPPAASIATPAAPAATATVLAPLVAATAPLVATAALPAKPPVKPSTAPIVKPLPIDLFLIEFPFGPSNNAFTFSSVNSLPSSFSSVSINSPKVNAASIEVAKPPIAPAKAPGIPPKAAPPAAPTPTAESEAPGESIAVPTWVPIDCTNNSGNKPGWSLTPLKNADHVLPSLTYCFWNFDIRSDGTWVLASVSLALINSCILFMSMLEKSWAIKSVASPVVLAAPMPLPSQVWSNQLTSSSCDSKEPSTDCDPISSWLIVGSTVESCAFPASLSL